MDNQLSLNQLLKRFPSLYCSVIFYHKPVDCIYICVCIYLFLDSSVTLINSFALFLEVFFGLENVVKAVLMSLKFASWDQDNT